MVHFLFASNILARRDLVRKSALWSRIYWSYWSRFCLLSVLIWTSDIWLQNALSAVPLFLVLVFVRPSCWYCLCVTKLEVSLEFDQYFGFLVPFKYWPICSSANAFERFGLCVNSPCCPIAEVHNCRFLVSVLVCIQRRSQFCQGNWCLCSRYLKGKLVQLCLHLGRACLAEWFVVQIWM